MNSKIVWAVIIILVVYGGYLMMTKTAAPVVETPAVENVVPTTEAIVEPVLPTAEVPAI